MLKQNMDAAAAADDDNWCFMAWFVAHSRLNRPENKTWNVFLYLYYDELERLINL